MLAGMDITGASAIVTGGASGIGAAVARALAARGAIVVVADLQAEKGEALADEIGGVFAARRRHATPSRSPPPSRPPREIAPAAGAGQLRRHRLGPAHHRPRRRCSSRPTTSTPFSKVVAINLIGTFDMIRQAATAMSRNEPDADGQRGAIVNLAERRRLRRPDRPGVVLRVQGRRRRHDPARRPRPVGVAASALNTVAPGLIDTPIYGEGRGPRGVQGQARRERAVPQAPRPAPTSSPAWSWSA